MKTKLKKTLIKITTSLILIPALCSCAVHSTDFVRCKNSEGQSCTSVSRINKMIDRGLISDEEESQNKESHKKTQQVSNTRKARTKSRTKKNDLEVWLPGKNEKFI